jgi:hypothetical protein
MDKRDAVWVAFRIAGLVLIVLAIVELPAAASAVAQSLHGDWRPAIGIGSKSELVVVPQNERNSLRPAWEVAVYLVAGLYFLSGAPRLYRLAVGEQTDSEVRVVRRVVGLITNFVVAVSVALLLALVFAGR